jgi:hypothetical protein
MLNVYVEPQPTGRPEEQLSRITQLNTLMVKASTERIIQRSKALLMPLKPKDSNLLLQGSETRPKVILIIGARHNC